MNKEKTIPIAIAAVAGGIIALSVQWFFSNYEYQKPIVLDIHLSTRAMFTHKVISPVPNSVSTINAAPKLLKKSVTLTPTPTKVAPKKRSLIPEVFASENSEMTDQQIADYIKGKDWDYSIAIRVAKSENSWNSTHSFNCSRVNTHNKDGSIDTGIFQINSIHTKEIEDWYSLPYGEVMKDCKRNIDFAYKLYSRNGWGAWAAYNNGSYKGHTEEI